MTKRTPTAARAAQIIVPFAVIVVASFAGIAWLSCVGAIALGWVIASALLREPRTEDLPPLRRFWFALAAPIVIGLVLIPLLVIQPPLYVLLPALAAGIVALYLALGYLMWWFIRLNEA
jgi:hypothetical protein